MKPMKISEKDLIELGFKIQDNTPESSGCDYDWYYYTLDIEDLCLITNANDEVEDNIWKVYIFDYNAFEFIELEKLKMFIDMLNEIKK